MSDVQFRRAGRYQNDSHPIDNSRYEMPTTGTAEVVPQFTAAAHGPPEGTQYRGRYFRDPNDRRGAGVGQAVTTAPSHALEDERKDISYPTCGDVDASTPRTVPAYGPGKENAPPSEEMSWPHHQHRQKLAPTDRQTARVPLSSRSRNDNCRANQPRRVASPLITEKHAQYSPPEIADYTKRECPITPFGLRFRYRQFCRDMGELWVDCRTQVKGKVTLIIKGPVPVDNFQEDYDLADRRSARNARKSPTSARR
ncbi:hypothetical protein Q9L58_006930 [Maublancomyces gigas]|uniref:Uncharacterized protein n=1 Tax=Discina gigas TaxID=1032678 RepID=A0ABR3GDV7_9PEZI